MGILWLQKIVKITKSKFLFLLLLLLTVIMFSAVVVRSSKQRPNIILITVDTLRADHLGIYGYPRKITPNIDGLGREGVLFQRAWVTIPKTTPSLVSIHSGLYPKTHGVIELFTVMDPAINLISERLQQSGFQTAGVCGQYNCHRSLGLARGFDYYDDNFDALPIGMPKPNLDGGGFHPEAERRAVDVVNAGIRWLKGRDPSKPAFLWLHFMDPHAGYAAPEPFRSQHLDPPPYSHRSYFGPNIPEELIDLQAKVGTETSYNYYLNQYDAEISYLDHEIGRFFSYLKTENLWNDALIIFTNDHGEYMGEFSYRTSFPSHGDTLFESEIQAPLLVKFPNGRFANKVVSRSVSLVDIYPFLAGTAKVDPGYHEGTDLLVAIDEPDRPDDQRPIFIQSPFPRGNYAVIVDHHKLLFRTRIPVNEVREVLQSKGFLEGQIELYLLPKIQAGNDEQLIQYDAHVQKLKKEIFDWLDSEPPVIFHAIKPEPTEESLEKLKSLGYVN